MTDTVTQATSLSKIIPNNAVVHPGSRSAARSDGDVDDLQSVGRLWGTGLHDRLAEYDAYLLRLVCRADLVVDDRLLHSCRMRLPDAPLT